MAENKKPDLSLSGSECILDACLNTKNPCVGTISQGAYQTLYISIKPIEDIHPDCYFALLHVNDPKLKDRPNPSRFYTQKVGGKEFGFWLEKEEKCGCDITSLF